jgi:hypothetical protein
VTSTQYVGTGGAALDSGKYYVDPLTGVNSGAGTGTNPSGLGSGTAFKFGSSAGVDAFGQNVDSTINTVGTADNSGSTNTDPTNSVTGSTVVPQVAGSLATPVEFTNAATGSGMGNFTITPHVTTAVPANAYAGSYQSTVTVAVVSGP